MQFDPNNPVVQLCAKGMEMELIKKPGVAKEYFLQAWEEATNDLEKFTAAHYVARHQNSVKDKLYWDEKALEFALNIDDGNMSANYPSLYLNIAKCHEDLKDRVNAQKNYQTALLYATYLPDNHYGQMIRSGIENGLKRISELQTVDSPQ